MTFPRKCESEKARACLDRLKQPYQVVSPEPGYRRVGVESLVMSQETRAALLEKIGTDVVSGGWVGYRPATGTVPSGEPVAFEEDIFGACSIVVMAPCVADWSKIRLIAHVSGNLASVFPYLNAEMGGATYCRDAETLTYMDGYRMVSLYAKRLTVAKADELVDAWRTLESIRCRVNDTWRRRASINPCWELRRKPPALEIYRRLPGTNCGVCGEKTCMAFALQLWNGAVTPALCAPVFSGDYERLKAALLEICSGLGVSVAVASEDEP